MGRKMVKYLVKQVKHVHQVKQVNNKKQGALIRG